VAALRHFRHLLEGRTFHVLTDHKPFVSALHKAQDPWSARQCRHMAYVAEFMSDLRHVAGADNVVVDCLSRPPVGLSLPSRQLPLLWWQRMGAPGPQQQQRWFLLPSRGLSGGKSWHATS